MEHECLICGRDLDEAICDHFVANLCDDGDGFDTEMPIYFGWSGLTQGHDCMIHAVHCYLARLKNLLGVYAVTGGQAGSEIRARCDELPEGEGATVRNAFTIVDSYTKYPDFDIDDALGEMGNICQSAFEDFYIRANGSALAHPYEIAHSPGLTWTGMNYWSDDGEKCALGIAKVATEAMGRLDAIIAAVQESKEGPN
jgi:hypothetical protein